MLKQEENYNRVTRADSVHHDTVSRATGFLFAFSSFQKFLIFYLFYFIFGEGEEN